MEVFESYLRDLNSSRGDADEIKSIIEKITHFLTEGKTETTNDLLVFLTLGENGILLFVKKSSWTDESTKPSVVAALELLQFVLVNFEKSCAPHAEDVIHLCLSMIRSDASAKIKENSLRALKEVFAPSNVPSVNAATVLSQIEHYLRENPYKTQSSVKGEMFWLVGLILERAPEVSQSSKDWFLNLFVDEIKSVLKKGKPLGTLSTLVKGCFEGISGYLENFAVDDKKIRSEVYECVKRYGQLQEDQTRRGPGRSALKIIIRHHQHIADFLCEDIEFWHEALKKWLEKLGDDRRLGFEGMVSIYRTFAGSIGPHSTAERLKSVADRLLTTPNLASTIGLVELVATGRVDSDLADAVMQSITKRSASESRSFGYLAVNLECVSRYLSKVRTVQQSALTHLRRVAISLLEEFPKMDPHFREQSLRALEMCFYNLAVHSQLELEEFVSDVVYQGLLRSCSHLTWTEVELRRELTGEELTSYKSYLPLWRHLTNLSTSDVEKDRAGLKNQVAIKVFDEYVSSFLSVNKKLDLGVEVVNANATDPEVAGRAAKPEDFQIFVNNVSLFVDVVEGCESPHLLKKWLTHALRDASESSFRNPLVSGYYKIATALFKTARKLRFFEEMPDEERKGCFATLEAFLREAVAKAAHSKGDLQISCLQAILAAPASLVDGFVEELVPTFKVLLRVGCGYLPLLEDCIDALERWHTELSKDSVDYLLRSVLHHFDVFLQSSGGKGFDEVESLRSSRKVKKAVKHVESQLLALQRKLLRFLGKLNESTCRQLIRGANTEVDTNRKVLSYDVPFADAKLRLHPEEWIQRVVDLSLSCGDRSTRATACELLHSLVLVTLGTMKQMNGELNGLFGRLVNTCVVLGCDPDRVVCQMYEPLALQMVHYYSQKERDHAETQVFVECLMGCVSHPFNPSLRDFAARLIREFTEWSLRDLTAEELRDRPNNVRAVLQSVCTLAVHPDHGKRCGAATAFNNLHTLVREHPYLLDTHSFQLYHCFVECLRMCSPRDDTTHIVNAVVHVKEALTGMAAESVTRITPPGFVDNSLASLVAWTFRRCCSEQPEMRKLAMNIVEDLSKCVHGCRSVKAFAEAYIRGDVHVEGPRRATSAREDDHALWLRTSAAFFHYYNWLLVNDVVGKSQLVDKGVMAAARLVAVGVDEAPNHLPKGDTVVSVLKFLLSCLRRGMSWHDTKTIAMVKTCVYSPRRYIPWSDRENRDGLEDVLLSLLPILATATTCLSPKDNFPDLLTSRETLPQATELLHGMELVHSLGLWNSSPFRSLCEKVRGDNLVNAVFEALFTGRRGRGGRCCVLLEPDILLFLRGLLRFAMKIGLNVESLLCLVVNVEEVVAEDAQRVTTKRDVFLTTFQDDLADIFATNFDEVIEKVLVSFSEHAMSFLLTVLRRSRTDPADLVEGMRRCWGRLQDLATRRKDPTLIVHVAAAVCRLVPDAFVAEVREILLPALSEPNIPEKLLFDLLPYASTVGECDNDDLASALDRIVDNLPLPGYVLDSLVNSFARTGSLVVLRRLLKLDPRALKNSRVHDMFAEGCSQAGNDHVARILAALREEAFAVPLAELFTVACLRCCEFDVAWNYLLDSLPEFLLMLQNGENLSANASVLVVTQVCLFRAGRERLERLPQENRPDLQELIGICLKSSTECRHGTTELRRRFACACFNTLCTYVATKTDDPKPYRYIIFKDGFSVLSNLVDKDRRYDLRFESSKTRKKKFLTGIAGKRRLVAETSRVVQQKMLAASSLHGDVSTFDTSWGREKSPREEIEVELEMDDVNGHECMATIVAVVEHMVTANVTPRSESTPFWLEIILRRVKSLSTSRNEKIFLLKLVLNVEEHVRPYAGGTALVADLLDALLVVFQESPLNTLVLDMIDVVFKTWNVDPTAFASQATQLIGYLVAGACNLPWDVAWGVLQVVNLLVGACTGRDGALSRLAFERMVKDRVERFDLEFCKILLGRSLSAWNDGDEGTFLKALFRHFGSSDRNRKLAGEVCGLALGLLKDANGAADMVRGELEQHISRDRASGLSLLHAVHKSYPEVLTGFAEVVLSSAWSGTGLAKTQGLEMVLAYATTTAKWSDRFRMSLVPFLQDSLSSGDVSVVDLSLRLLDRVRTDLKPTEELSAVIDKALLHADSKSVSVRKSVYNIATTLEGRTARVVLLRGMDDDDGELAEKCVAFWQERTQASTSAERFARVLAEVYAPEVEAKFLGFAARIMMRSARASDSETTIFEHPLARDSTHRKRKLLTTMQHSAIVPMFAQTLTSQLEQEVEAVRPTPAVEGPRREARRFVRDKAYFARRHALKVERKVNIDVEILREYSDGVYPNIQISHGDVLRPLEALSRKDPQMGRHLVTSLYEGFVERTTEDDALHERIREFVAAVLEEGEDASVVAFVFHVLLNSGGRLVADADTVARFAKASGWLAVGGFLIERMIVDDDEEEAIPAKTGEVTREERLWLNLAELSRLGKESDVLRGIFLDKLRVDGDAAAAIRSESAEDWTAASRLYASAMSSPRGVTERKDFYVDAYLTSLARLSDWSNLSSHVRRNHDMEELWSDTRLFENVLPWYLKSEGIASLRSGSDAFLRLVSDLRGDPEKESYLKELFMEDMAIAHFSTGDLRWLSYYLHQLSVRFLSSWNKWSDNLRADRLLRLGVMSELEQCLSVLSEKRTDEAEEKAREVAASWSRNIPCDRDDLMIWDTKLACRERFLSLLEREHPDVGRGELERLLIVSGFGVVRAGIAQRNVGFAGALLERVGLWARSSRDRGFILMLDHCDVSLTVLREEGNDDDGFGRLVDAGLRLQRLAEDAEEVPATFLYECHVGLSKVVRRMRLALGRITEKVAVRGLARMGISTANGLNENLVAKELQHLENAVRALQGQSADELLSKAYVEIAKARRSTSGYSAEVAKCLFRAMSLGSTEGRQLVGCLLSEVQLAKDYQTDPDLRKCCGGVPAWMYLGWTNQILANLDSGMFPFLKDLVSLLAEEYPDALRYSLRLSAKNYTGGECRRFAEGVARKLMADSVHENFLTALSYVAVPELVFKYRLNKIMDELRKTQPMWSQVEESIRELLDYGYGAEFRDYRGGAFACMAGVRAQLEEVLRRKRSTWKERIAEVAKALPRSRASPKLKSYSPWLSAFPWTSHGTRIEIPGQYNGEQKPLVKYHVTVSSFRYDVTVMNSKCRPIRVTILGNDARDYGFLVKFGEDLRQDQRIQQVFRHMNQWSLEEETVDTYRVVPLSTSLGLIEWVNGTSSLFELMVKSDERVEERVKTVQQEHLEFLAGDASVTSPVVAHLNGYDNVDCSRAVARFEERVHAFDWDLLRKALTRLSSSPDHFVHLRRNFAVSLAATYVAHWLVGIGDRHLENILVATRSGRVLGIDFGCAFGFGTEFLTPPELVPFRLTPQIVNLMKPMGESGLIKETMTRCVRGFRREHFLLLAILEVFALEPSLDWLEKTRRNEEDRGGSDEGLLAETAWSPRRKLSMVRDKLNGVDPVEILCDDLTSGHANSPYLDKYLAVLRGNRKSFRGRKLTPEEEVERLIDIATDRHILSKTYVGWNPWL